MALCALAAWLGSALGLAAVIYFLGPRAATMLEALDFEGPVMMTMLARGGVYLRSEGGLQVVAYVLIASLTPFLCKGLLRHVAKLYVVGAVVALLCIGMTLWDMERSASQVQGHVDRAPAARPRGS